MIDPLAQALSVIIWLLIVKIIQMSIYPHLMGAFGRFSYPVAYPLGILLIAFFTWYSALINVPVVSVLVVFFILCFYNIFRKKYSPEDIRSNLRWDAVFLLFFIIGLSMRYENPAIAYAEKFMDHAFLSSVIWNPVIPPVDPWYAGGGLDVYYYYGYWIFGMMGLLGGAPSGVAFNLSLPTVLGLSAEMAYATGTLLLKRFRWLAVVPLLLVNPSYFYQIIMGSEFYPAMWDSTRTIQDSIHEYPIFSFLWGDLHPHVIGIFNQLFFIFLMVYAYLKWDGLERTGRILFCLVAALSLGAMPLINSWDVIVYAPFTLIFSILIFMKYRKVQDLELSESWMPLILVPVLSFLFYLPFYIMLNSAGIEGIGIVRIPSDPISFILVHGWFLLILVLYVGRDIIGRPLLLAVPLIICATGYVSVAIASIPLIYLVANRRFRVPELLAIFGLFVIIFPELFYLVDNMGDLYYRMNTVFKLYLPAWIMIGCASMLFVGEWLARLRVCESAPVALKKAISVIAVAILLLSPFVFHIDLGYGGGTLDGLAFLEKTNPADAEAISFLMDLGYGHVVVEAEGGDYKYFSRVSSLTGFPTVIGMPFHEQMWRGDSVDVLGRARDVRSIYEDPAATVQLMKKYGADLLYVGATESERYDVQLPAGDLELIYDRSGVRIFRLVQ